MLNFEKGFVIDLLDFCKRFFKKSALGNGTPLVPEQPQAAQE